MLRLWKICKQELFEYLQIDLQNTLFKRYNWVPCETASCTSPEYLMHWWAIFCLVNFELQSKSRISISSRKRFFREITSTKNRISIFKIPNPVWKKLRKEEKHFRNIKKNYTTTQSSFCWCLKLSAWLKVYFDIITHAYGPFHSPTSKHPTQCRSPSHSL